MISKTVLVLAAASSVAIFQASASAQSRGVFTNYPDSQLLSTSFIDRGVASTNGNAVELLNEMPQGAVAGLGDNGTACRIHSMLMVLQDEEASTQEQWRLMARPRDMTTGGPDTSNVVFQTGALSTPPGLTGGQAWIFTVTFNTPATVPCDTWFYGVALNAAPLWPGGSDGLSMHMAHYTMGTLGAHPRATAPNLGWSNDASATTVSSHDYVWAVTLNPDAPSMQVGAIDPGSARVSASTGHPDTSFGVAGFFPDVSGAPRSDGIATRIYDAGNPGAVTGVLFSLGPNAVGAAIPGVTGRVYIDFATLLGFAGSAIPNSAPEEAIRTFLPANSLPATLAGNSVWFQGVVLTASNTVELTNAVAVNF